MQQRADDLIRQAIGKWTELWNLIYTQDLGNQQAKADVVVDGKTLLQQVPVTFLLFLDKQVNDLKTFISKLPTPDPAEEWSHDVPESAPLGLADNSILKPRPGRSAILPGHFFWYGPCGLNPTKFSAIWIRNPKLNSLICVVC